MRQVEGRQVLVVERRPLAAVGIVGLERRRDLRVLDDGVHAGADLLHDAEIGVELLQEELLGAEFPFVLLAFLEVGDLAGEVVVVGPHGGAAGRDPGEPGPPGPGPAGFVGPGRTLLIGGGALVAHVDGGWRALEDVEFADDLGEFGNRLHRRGAGADDADALTLQVDVVVPAGGVEGLALERPHPFDARQLGRGQDAVGEDDEARPHRIAAVGPDDPAPGRLVPGGLLDRGVEQAVFVEAEHVGEPLTVFEDLETRGEFHRRDIARLLEERQVAVGLHIAGDARIAVPVPGAADVAALLAETDVLEAGVAQLVPEQQTGEAAAHHQDFALVGQRLPLDRRRRVDIGEVFREVAFQGDVVGGAAARLLERAVSGLFLGIEGGAGRELGHGREPLVGDNRVALAGDPVVGHGGAGVEDLQAGGGIDADRRGHGFVFLLRPSGGPGEPLSPVDLKGSVGSIATWTSIAPR